MNDKDSNAPQATGSRRFDWLDALRGVALIAMTTFHFSWDLEFFGYAPAGLTSQPLFKWYARGIAFSFLVIAGFSFALAHRNGINGRTFIKRLAQIGGAALLISLVTWYTTPERFVFFGILHQIAAAALISALFLRANAAGTMAVAVVIAILPHVFRHELFNQSWFWWTGLGTVQPATNDFVPVFPWTAYVLLGLALGKLAIARQALSSQQMLAPVEGKAGRGLVFLGQHSLIYYLLHQPALFGLLGAIAFLFPPDRSAAFVASCEVSCQAQNPGEFCKTFCGCVRDELSSANMLNEVISGKRDGSSDPQVLEYAMMCTNRAGATP
jgi:uncharacterized membrane protein